MYSIVIVMVSCAHVMCIHRSWTILNTTITSHQKEHVAYLRDFTLKGASMELIFNSIVHTVYWPIALLTHEFLKSTE